MLCGIICIWFGHELCSTPNYFFPLYFADNNYKELAWGALDDVVMGGVSEGAFRVDQNGGENGRPTGLFRGFFLSSTQTQEISYLSIWFLILAMVASVLK